MMKIDNVTLKVKDIDKMTDFYEKVLGMKVRKRDSTRSELGTDKDTLLILKTNEKLNYRKPETANLYHIAYLLPERADLAVFLRHIMNIGFNGIGAADHLVSEAIYLNDPENNGIEIYTDRNQKVWNYTDNGDVVMDTLSLDADELYYLSSHSDFRMPDGTRIGHVHMQGVNIPEIRKFYEDILLLNKTAVMPNAVFLSYDGYHHHFAFNHWDSRISKPGDNLSTGLEIIEYEVDKDRYENIKNNAEKNLKYPDLEIMDGYFMINDLNNVKLIINNKK